LLNRIENCWLSLLKLLHKLSGKIWVLNHSLPYHWETWVAHQSLNLCECLWVKVVLSKTSISFFHFFIPIILLSCTTTASGWDLWNMTTHQEFESNIWNSLSCLQSLGAKFFWFSRNCHELVYCSLHFWRHWLSLGSWLWLSCGLRLSSRLRLSCWHWVCSTCSSSWHWLLLLFILFLWFWSWLSFLDHGDNEIIFFDVVITCRLCIIFQHLSISDQF